MNQNMTAETATNWAVARIAGAAPSSSLDNSIFRQGAASMAAKIANANTDAVLIYDYYTDHGNATLDLSSGNQHVLVWVLYTSISAMRLQSEGGMYILLQSSTETGTTAPTVYSKWYIHGRDTYPGGWIAVLIDPTKTASATAGGGVNLSAIRRIGVGTYTQGTVPTIKAENLYVDAIRYGKPLYQVVGDGSTTATWADFVSNSTSDENGLFTDLGGAYSVSSGIRFGSGSQTATTTFADATAKNIIFKRHTYYQSSVMDAVDYTNVYAIDALGAASFRTSIILGSVVGSGDDRQGVLGGSILSSDITNVTWKTNFQTDKTDLSAVKFYGVNFSGMKGGMLLDNNSGGTETSVISCSFVNCGEIDPGTTGNGAEIISCSIIDPLGGTSANRGLRMPSVHRIKKINCITSGTPTTQHLVHLNSGGTYTITFDAIKFFGSYSSSTIWHGEASANSAVITLGSTNSSNPDANEFEKTGSPPATVTVQNNITIKVKVTGTDAQTISGVQTAVYRSSDDFEIVNADTDGNGEVSNTYNLAVSPTTIYVRARKSSTGTRYIPTSTTASVTGDITIFLTLLVDPNV